MTAAAPVKDVAQATSGVAALDGGRTVALVMDGFINGLGVIRSLAELKSIPIILVCRAGDTASWSKHVQEVLHYRTEDELIERLTEVNRRFDHIVPFPCSDWHSRILNQIVGRLNKFHFPRTDLKLLDKCEQTRIAKDIGVDCPSTLFFEEDFDPSALSQLRKPYIIKPCISEQNNADRRKGYRKLLISEDEAESAEALRQMTAEGHRCLVSEYIHGNEGVYSYCGYATEGKVVASYLGQKLIEAVPTMTAAIARSLPLDQEKVIDQASRKLVAAFGLTGIFEIEFKRCALTGKVYFIEINPRSWLWNDLATEEGVNLSMMYFLNEAGRDVENDGADPSANALFVWGAGVLTHMVKYRTFKPLGIILRSVISPKRRIKFAIFKLSDPMPFFRVLINHVTYIAGMRAGFN